MTHLALLSLPLKEGLRMWTFTPELSLLIFVFLILIFGAFQRRSGAEREFATAYFLSLGAVFVAALELWQMRVTPATVGFFGVWEITTLGIWMKLGVMAATFLTLLATGRYLRNNRQAPTEYFAMILFSVVGMLIMISARELLTFFLGLEILSLPLYVLCCFRHEEKLSGNESGLKYFILGSFSSAFFLFGVAIAYGAFQSTNLFEISGVLDLNAQVPSTAMQLKTLAAFAMMAIGLSFKVSLFPFHLWTPDVYQGAPTPVTAFMASGVKIAGFIGLINLAVVTFSGAAGMMTIALSAVCILTMFFANFAALAQRNVKRMLAYSSLSHAGYILIGVIAAAAMQRSHVQPLPDATEISTPFANSGVASVAFYLLAYAVATVGAFALISFLDYRKDEGVTNESIRGFGFRHPLLGALLALFMFNLAGIPPMVGFVAKFYVFFAAIDAGFIGLAIIGALNSMIAVYYYLRVVVAIYMRSEEKDAVEVQPAESAGISGVLAVSVCGLLVLAMGIFPGWLLKHLLSGSTFPGS